MKIIVTENEDNSRSRKVATGVHREKMKIIVTENEDNSRVLQCMWRSKRGDVKINFTDPGSLQAGPARAWSLQNGL